MMIKEVKYVFDTGKKKAEFKMSKNQKGNTETVVTFFIAGQIASYIMSNKNAALILEVAFLMPCLYRLVMMIRLMTGF